LTQSCKNFADDALILITGKYPSDLVKKAQPSVNAMVAWGKDSGLEFNASKTIAVMFTNKKPYDIKKPHDYPVKVVINNKKIDFSAEAKYLGILFDSKLTWASHITAKIAKSKRLLFAVKNCIAKARLGTDAAQKKLSSINRLACLSLGSVPTSTPTATMEILYNLRPLDLELERIALKTYVRIKKALPSKKNWDGLPTGGGNRLGHQRHWENALNSDNLSTTPCDQDQTSKVRSWVKNFEVLDFESKCDIADQYRTWTCYTDGSKMGNRSGYGYLINWSGRTIYKGHDHMGPRATVFMAEVRAISTVVHTLMQRKNQRIEIRSDSQAAITAISNINISSNTVLECRNLLNRLGSKNKITIRWVKAHNAHEGNELADSLAKTGANQSIGPPRFKYFEAAASFSQKLLNQSNQKWQKRWEKNPTTYKHSKEFIYIIQNNIHKMNYVLKHCDRTTVGILTQFITSHSFNLKASKSNTPDKVCRHCNQDDTPETPSHILTTCPALTEARREWFDGQDLLTSGFDWLVPHLLGFLRNTNVWGSMTQQL
jgi:ribonuclease HI